MPPVSSNTDTDNRLPPSSDSSQSSSTTPAVVPSNELLRGQKTVDIDHNGTLYRLQSTRAGKLILTK